MKKSSKKAPPQKPAPIFTGRVEKGMLTIDGTSAYQNYLRGLEGQHVEIIVRRQTGGRSKEQNAFYWGVVIPLLCETTGYLPEEMHEELKRKLLTVHFGQDTELSIIGSTAALDQQQFSIYLEQVILLAAELGCVIPDPRTVDI